MSRSNAPAAPRIPRPRRRPVSSRAEALRRYRRPLAAALAALAVASLLSSLAPPNDAERRVLVMVADRPAGAELLASDVGSIEVSGPLEDPGLPGDPHQVVGQRLAVGLPAGALLSEHVLIGPQLLAGSAPGTVAVPIRLSDAATVELLHPGQLVDIVLSSGDGFEREISSETIGHRLPVLWVPAAPRDQGLGMLPSAAGGQEGIVVVAAAASLADELSGAVTRGKVSAVLVN